MGLPRVVSSAAMVAALVGMVGCASFNGGNVNLNAGTAWSGGRPAAPSVNGGVQGNFGNGRGGTGTVSAGTGTGGTTLSGSANQSLKPR